MAKKSINLIVKTQAETTVVHRARKFLPIAAGVSIFIFITVFVANLIYINANLAAFKLSEAEARSIVKKIEASTETEATYILTANLVSKLNTILSSDLNYTNITGEIFGLKSDELKITSVNIDENGDISLAITVDSVTTLDEFVRILIDKEERDHKFNNIEAYGIVRDKDSKYILTVILKADKSLLQ